MSDQPETTSKPKTRKNAAHADTDGATPPAPAGEARELPSIDISSEMRTAYRDYSMSVIVGRALPDVRDGLKPVHRRILYAMYDQNLLSSQKFSKCAGTVGEVLKKYHPHGDAAVYDALVRLAQNWNMGLTLVDGQGNFGSVDGDPAAAYRYTEARLTKVAESLLEDIEQRTVDFTPNFDGSHQEPTVLPARIPNLLVNGSEGIAVAMATRCPPHNLNECINALLAMISEQYEGGPVVDTPKLMQLMPGPDFPTGGMICGREGIAAYYETGRGTLKLRGKVRLEDNEKNKRTQIIVDEIPFQVNKARLVERIAELVRDKVIEGIAEIRDESDRDGMRIALDLKRDAVGEIVLNQLFKRTPLQTTFSVNMLAIVDGQPRTLSMRELLLNFIDFRREVVTRRSRFQLDEAERRYHVLAGLIVALDDIDKIIDIIRSSPNTEEAKARLCAEKFKNALKIGVFSDATTPQIGGWLKQKHAQLDEIQAQAILEMRLARLVGLERDKLLNEAGEILKDIARLRDILGNLSTLIGVIKEELLDIRTRFTTPRRCRITDQVDEISVEDLIVDEEMLVTITNSGYIKRIALSNYRTQKRGGKGKSAAKAKEEDFVADAFVASTHAYLLVFTSRGRVYWLKVHQVPEVTAQARGRAIVNLINIDSDEKVCAVVPVRRFPEKEDEAYVVTCTKNGTIKKTDLTAYSNPRSTGLIACSIDNGDELLAASITDGKSEILLSTAEGLAIRFPESDVRPMGRGATGVRAISLREADLLVGVEIVASNAEGKSILSVTEGGYGKRTDLAEYRSQSRGGIGIITIKTTDRRGRVAGVIQVHDGDQIMLITNRGTLIRVRADDVRESGRNTQGVKLINVADDERVISIKRIAEPEEEDENGVAGAAGALNGAANSANGATNGAAGGGKAAGKDTDA